MLVWLLLWPLLLVSIGAILLVRLLTGSEYSPAVVLWFLSRWPPLLPCPPPPLPPPWYCSSLSVPFISLFSPLLPTTTHFRFLSLSSSVRSSWFLLSASSLSLISPLLWLFVMSGTIVTHEYMVFFSSLDLSRRCLLSSSVYSPITMGLGSFPFSPTLLQKRIWYLLVLALIPPKILSHSPLSASILSLGSEISGPGSGTPCSTRFSLLDSLSRSSSSIILSVLSAELSLSLARSRTSFLVASSRRRMSSMFFLLSSTFASVASCFLAFSLMRAFHFLLKFIQERQAQ